MASKATMASSIFPGGLYRPRARLSPGHANGAVTQTRDQLRPLPMEVVVGHEPAGRTRVAGIETGRRG